MNLAVLSGRLPKSTRHQDVLTFPMQEKLLDNLPNAAIALRILLTPPMSVASSEHGFSKLKLIKMFVRATVLLDRLSCHIH